MFNFQIRKKEVIRKIREERFRLLVKRYMESAEVQRMGEYIQHGTTTTLVHCQNVAWLCFLVNEVFHLKAKERELVEAAFLHDFYLYDWHDGDPVRKTHGFDHPYIACKNAVEVFDVSDHTKAAIKSHMWPLNIKELPKSREAIIICIIDKYCSIFETLKICRQYVSYEQNVRY